MKKYRKAVSVLVMRLGGGGDGREPEILLVHKPRTMDAWQLPQGGIEDGESLEEAALRELREETGLTLQAVQYVSTAEYSYDFPPEFRRRDGTKPERDGQSVRFVVLEVPLDAAVRVDNDEIDDCVWVTVGRLGDYLKRETYLQVVHGVMREYEGRKSDAETM